MVALLVLEMFVKILVYIQETFLKEPGGVKVLNADYQKPKIAGIFTLKVKVFLSILLHLIGKIILNNTLTPVVMLILIVIQNALIELHAGVVLSMKILSIMMSNKKTFLKLTSLVLVMKIVQITPMEIQLVDQEQSMVTQFQTPLQYVSHLSSVAFGFMLMMNLALLPAMHQNLCYISSQPFSHYIQSFDMFVTIL